MNRKNTFRGKRTDNGEGVYGYYLKDDITGQSFIFPIGNSVNESDKVGEEGCLKFVAFEVVPETIGQYTGFNDKNGREIYEGDIIAVNSEGNNVGVEEKISTFVIKYTQIDLCWNNGFGVSNLTGYGCITHIAKDDMSNIEVVGNIYHSETLVELN